MTPIFYPLSPSGFPDCGGLQDGMKMDRGGWRKGKEEKEEGEEEEEREEGEEEEEKEEEEGEEREG